MNPTDYGIPKTIMRFGQELGNLAEPNVRTPFHFHKLAFSIPGARAIRVKALLEGRRTTAQLVKVNGKRYIAIYRSEN